MLFDFAEKKDTFLTFKNSPQNRMFSKGIIYNSSKNANYLVYLDLVKIRVEIMFSDLTEKK